MIEPLRDARRVYLDTPPVIYFIEEQAEFLPLVVPLFLAIATGAKQGVSSYLTLMELLVQPFRKGRDDLVRLYRTAILDQPHFRLVGLERAVAEEAARIRAKYNFRVADAIQLATALLERADAFVTNDHRLRSYRELAMVILDDHREGSR